jgi:hypothetical protein
VIIGEFLTGVVMRVLFKMKNERGENGVHCKSIASADPFTGSNKKGSKPNHRLLMVLN